MEAIAPNRSKVGIAECFRGPTGLAPLVLAPRRSPPCRRPPRAGVGDLLVAPTRIVLDGRKGAEIVLNNIGDEPATYRISVEFRRMTEDGSLGT